MNVIVIITYANKDKPINDNLLLPAEATVVLFSASPLSFFISVNTISHLCQEHVSVKPYQLSRHRRHPTALQSASAFVALHRRTSQTCASRCQQHLVARVYGRAHAVT